MRRHDPDRPASGPASGPGTGAGSDPADPADPARTPAGPASDPADPADPVGVGDAERKPSRRRRRRREDPWQAADPALALALAQVRWYARHRDRARTTYQVNEVLILLTTAATTVMAALKVNATATAILAASTVVLAGLYKVIDAHENWLAFGGAWAELQIAINDYRLLPAGQRNEHAQRMLVRKVNEVNSAETGRWVSRRRSLAAGGQ